MSAALFNYAVVYVSEHPSLQIGFELSDADLDRLFATLVGTDAEVSREDFDGSRRFIRYQLEREIASQLWGEDGEFLQMRRYDRQLERATELARSPVGPQAYRFDRVMATQFHPEATETMLAKWSAGAGDDELRRVESTREHLMERTRSAVEQSRPACDRLVDWFLGSVAEASARRVQ